MALKDPTYIPNQTDTEPGQSEALSGTGVASTARRTPGQRALTAKEREQRQIALAPTVPSKKECERNIMTRIDPMKRTLLKLFGLTALGGCASAKGEGRSVSAVVINYTDRYIADVSVNGRWAGSANAYGGEGNRVDGFLAPPESNKRMVLKIKWEVGSYYSIKDDSYTRAPIEARTADVELATPYPPNPSYLILHFFPDGHVEIELSADRPTRKIPKPAGYHR